MIIRRFIAIILCICLVPLSVLITTTSVSIRAFDDPIFWKNHLDRANIYSLWQRDEALRTSLQESIARELPLSDNTAKDLVSEATAKAVVASIGDPGWIEDTISHIIDELVVNNSTGVRNENISRSFLTQAERRDRGILQLPYSSHGIESRISNPGSLDRGQFVSRNHY